MYLTYFSCILVILLSLACIYETSYSKEASGSGCSTGAGTCSAVAGLEASVLTSHNQQLDLVASGVRKKTILFVNVEVYSLGVYVAPSVDQAFQKSIGMTSSFEEAVSLLARAGPLQLRLSFLRTVATKSVVDALVEALAGPAIDPLVLQQFRDIIVGSVGKGGFAAKDTIDFLFEEDGKSLTVLVQGAPAGALRDAPLRHVLLGIYLGDRSITPQARICLQARYGSCSS